MTDTKQKKFYITAAIPYVNAKPHIGHALEFIQTNTIARYHRLLGEDVNTLCGGDENALKNVQAAEAAGQPVQQFVDQNTDHFYDLTTKLNTTFNVWQKGSDQKHHQSSQKLWQLCDQAGDIYKQSYQGLYCIGCETFYSPDELDENGECPEHPGKKLDQIKEENYFFRLSKYQDQLIQLIESDQLHIVPDFRKNEILSFIKSGLKDISISRSNERAKNWGVPVPDDNTQRIYVWFDALNIYQSGLGFGWDEDNYNQWWPADVHVIGKGIIRFHAVYWIAFLLSARLKLPKKIFVHEYFTVDGKKMGKSIGNVYNPIPILDKLGADPLRYYCLAKISPFSDGDFSEDKLIAAYNSDLANGLGNLIQRTVGLLNKYYDGIVPEPVQTADDHPLRISKDFFNWKQSWKAVDNSLETYQFNQGLEGIWKFISSADRYIEANKPWELSKAGKQKELDWVIYGLCDSIHQLAWQLLCFLPDTSKKIAQAFGIKPILVDSPNYKDSWTNIKPGTKVELKEALFPRIEK